MSRRKIKKVTQNPKSYGDEKQQFPTVSIRPNGVNKIHKVKQNIQKRTFKTKTGPLLDPVKSPINFLSGEFANVNKDICFVVGGGPSLNGFDFSLLNGFDTIAINKAVEYIQNPTYFITTDYSYFIKASLPIDQIKLKTQKSYFVANMSHDYMKLKRGQIVDTRRNFVYEDLYKYDGVIQSYNKDKFSSTINEFSHGENSGHCGIQLALLLGYKKIYLLGFDLNNTGQSHFHQSYRDIDQKSFKQRVRGYGETLLKSLAQYTGSQKIINLSRQSILVSSPHIKTESFNDIIKNKLTLQTKVNPNDNSTLNNLMVVGYYTVNTPYEEEAQNLIRSLNKLGINHNVIGVKTLGNWQANTRFKAGFMLDMLVKWPKHRLLYVDVDAVVHKMPDLFKNYKCDIAVRWQDFRWRKNECLSGTIYMENNERTKRICQLWRDINVKEGNESNRMEQW